MSDSDYDDESRASASANAEVARLFAEIGDILEIRGEPPYRYNAYRTGARSVGNAPESLDVLFEQGRVDVLLQASTKDRRTIFEEAAGISRFKAKKIETLRKLERVDGVKDRALDEIEARQSPIAVPATDPKIGRRILASVFFRACSMIPSHSSPPGRARTASAPPNS